jgi:predicted nucleic acid-binding protein
MNLLVIDSSVAAKWFVSEPDRAAALSLLGPETLLYAPDFFLLEMDSIVSKWVRRRVLSVSDGQATRASVRQVPMKLHPTRDLIESAFQLALWTKSSFYDCLYLALSVTLDRPVVTADRRFFDNIAAGRLRSHVRWVGDLA